MSILIHVGYPKTGTTWLQQSVFPAHPHISYWHFGDPAYPWIEQVVHAHDDEFDAAEFRATRIPELGEGAMPAVISWESLSGDIWAGASDSFRNAQRLKALFPEARILITVRNQVQMIESMYRQYVQEGGPLTLKALLALEFPSRMSFRLEHLQFDRLIRHYQDLFGAEHVRVYLYEDLIGRGQALVDDLSEWCDWPPAQLPAAALARQHNPSLSYLSIVTARVLNRFVWSHLNVNSPLPRRIFHARYVRDFFRRVMDPFVWGKLLKRRTFIDRATESRLNRIFAPSNRVLLDEFNLRVDRHGYPLDVSHEAEPSGQRRNGARSVIARQLFVGSSLVAVGLLLGRAMGFVRDSALAHVFGVGADADIVVALVTLPDALLSFLALGALSAALIPEFAKASDHAQADRFFWRASIVTGLGAVALAGIVAPLAPQMLGLLAPGIGGTQADIAARYLPVAFAAIPLTVLAGVSTARLQASRVFLVPALGTLIYNAVIVATVVWFLDPQSRFRSFAIGIFVAAAIRWLTQLIRLRAWRPPAKVTGPVLDREVLRRYLQAVMSLGAVTLLPVVAKAIASAQGPGALTQFHFSQRLVELPMALAVGTIAVVAFPVMAAAFAQGRETDSATTGALVGVLLAALPICSFMFVFREPLAALAFGGEPNDPAIAAISTMVGIGLVTVPIQGLTAIAVAIFNARLDTFAPAVINFVVLVAFAPLAWVLGNVAGSNGIMAALVIANAAAALSLIGSLYRRQQVALWNVVRLKRVATAVLICLVAVAAIDRVHSARGSLDPLSAALLVVAMLPVAVLVLRSPARTAA